MSRACSRLGEVRNVLKILIGKPTGKRSLRRHRRSCEENIRIDLEYLLIEKKNDCFGSE